MTFDEWPPLVKWKWALAKQTELERVVGEYQVSRPAAFVAEFRPRRPGHDIRFVVNEPPPSQTGLLIGDVVTNLRASLDYAVYELTIAHSGHELSGTAFPVCKTLQAWNQTSKSTGKPATNTGLYKVRGVSRTARSIIRFHQPFHRVRYWRRPLWVIDELCNIDKHRTIHVTTTAPTVGQSTVSIVTPSVGIVRDRSFHRHGARDGAIIRRLTYTSGTTARDVTVESRLTSHVTFGETTARQGGGYLVGTVRVLFDYVAHVLAQLSTCDSRIT